jgi:hypothetical protein
MPAAQELGKALSNPSLKGSTFVVAGHTDAIGSYAFNRISLSGAPTPSRTTWCRSSASMEPTS